LRQWPFLCKIKRTMLRRAALFLLVAPLAANAQITVIEEANDDGFINIEECASPDSDGLAFSWTLTTGGTSTDTRLIVSDDDISAVNGNCDPEGTYWTYDDDDLVVDPVNSRYPSIGYEKFLQVIQSTLGLTCSEPTNKTLNVCVEGVGYYATGSIKFDTRPAPAPTISGITAVEEALIVNVAAGTVSSYTTQDDSETYQAIATGIDGVPHYSETSSSTSLRIGGLENGVEYTVYAYAFTEADNPSPASAASTGTPIPVVDFWEGYRNAGGREDGGCASGPAGLLALIFPFVFVLRRRRS
jgi:hypothetical protein